MAYFKTISKGRTKAYHFTIDSYDDEMFKALKESVKAYNIQRKKDILEYAEKRGEMPRTMTFQRVCVKGRGPRRGNIYHTQLCDATHFDVYLQDRVLAKGYDY